MAVRESRELPSKFSRLVHHDQIYPGSVPLLAHSSSSFVNVASQAKKKEGENSGVSFIVGV